MKGYSVTVHHLCKIVKNKRQYKEILHDTSFEVKSGEFVAIIGCSGAGKTTLMNLMSGYSSVSSGQIFINDVDVSKEYGNMKGNVAYVPQREILHDVLTLKETLYYAMQLRIPNITKEQKEQRLIELLTMLELEGRENTKIKNLSGGEKKRTAIAMELLNQPKLFLLDEPTSGLDSNIEKKIMKKLRQLSNDGQTIVMTAHTISNLYMCDKVIVMGQNGKICYCGNYEGIFDYFGIEDFIDVYDVLKNDTDVYYEKYCHFVKEREPVVQDVLNKKKTVGIWKQTGVLTKRNLNMIWNHKMWLLLLLLEAPMFGILICLVSPQDGMTRYRDALMGLEAFTLAATWLGTFNSAQEVVKERHIIKKEYMSGMHFISYLLSKLLVMILLCLYQTFVIVTIVYNHLNPFPSDSLFVSPYIGYLITYFLVTFGACMTGIFISSIARDRETTLIITPLYMATQLLFSGGFVAFNWISEKISFFVIGRWSMEGFGIVTNMEAIAHGKYVSLDLSQIDLMHLGDSFLTYFNQFKDGFSELFMNYYFLDHAQTYYSFTGGHLLFVWGILLFTAIIFIGFSILAVKKSILRKE